MEFDQGPFGAACRKATCVSGTLKGLERLRVRGPGTGHLVGKKKKSAGSLQDEALGLVSAEVMWKPSRVRGGNGGGNEKDPLRAYGMEAHGRENRPSMELKPAEVEW